MINWSGQRQLARKTSGQQRPGRVLTRGTITEIPSAGIAEERVNIRGGVV